MILKKIIATVLVTVLILVGVGGGIRSHLAKMPKQKAEKVREVSDRLYLQFFVLPLCLGDDDVISSDGRTCKEVKTDLDKVSGEPMRTLLNLY